MPLPILTAQETPQQRTCASYTVKRLGLYPSMEMVFTETVSDVVILTVTSASDTNDDSKFDTLEVTIQYSPLSSSVYQDWVTEIVGKTILKVDDSSFGVCESVGENLSIKLVEGVDSDPTGLVLHYIRINGFGEMVSRPALNGLSFLRTMSARVPAQLAKMQEVLGTVSFTLTSAVIAQLGLTASPQDIGAALATMAASGDNLDSFIVRELEALQGDIDDGTVDLG
jgi:hypothetical protein